MSLSRRKLFGVAAGAAVTASVPIKAEAAFFGPATGREFTAVMAGTEALAHQTASLHPTIEGLQRMGVLFSHWYNRETGMHEFKVMVEGE